MLKALLDVEVVSRPGRTNISKGVEAAILTYLKSGMPPLVTLGSPNSTARFRPPFIENSGAKSSLNTSRVVELQTIEDCWRESVIVAEQDLFGITEDSRAAVYVATEVAHTDCRCQCVAKVPSVGICELMIDATV